MSRRVLAGRIKKGLAKEALNFLVSDDIQWDSKLVEEDVTGNEAHAVMLWKSGILSRDMLKRILEALERVRTLNREGKFKLDPKLEDVHLNIENFVTGEAGIEAGGALHTGRSRNDQIILDMRLYLRKEINEVTKLIIRLIGTILEIAKKHVYTVMPGYTHLQHAQPVTFAHWLLSYVEMLLRDVGRLEVTYRQVNLNPLGACALAGTSWPIDRKETSRLLGFEGIQENSMDVITSRGEDVAETLADLSILMVHLSRLSEDLVFWSTYEFGMVEFDDAYAMGSSIMPQKKNPDVAELIRGKTSTVISQLFLTLSLMKNLPSGYFKDLQESKHAVFKAVETVKSVLLVACGMLATMKINKRRMLELASANFSTATDLADLIVKRTGTPFRVAHQITGLLISNAIATNQKVTDIGSDDLKQASSKVVGKEITIPDDEIKKALNPLQSIRMKRSTGSPNPKEVLRMIREKEKEVKKKANSLSERVEAVDNASKELRAVVKSILGS